ncbi:MAG: hypothetical protein WA459_21645 [Stellaceae bacterium]
MAAEAVRAFMLSWFLSHNYSLVHAEAMIQQAKMESGLKPCTRSRTGSWLYGWTGSRRHALAAYAGTSACPGLETQLAFADHELRSVPVYAPFWRASAANTLVVLRQCFGRGRC